MTHPIDSELEYYEQENDESIQRLTHILENWHRLSEEDEKIMVDKLLFMANKSRYYGHPSKLN